MQRTYMMFISAFLRMAASGPVRTKNPSSSGVARRFTSSCLAVLNTSVPTRTKLRGDATCKAARRLLQAPKCDSSEAEGHWRGGIQRRGRFCRWGGTPMEGCHRQGANLNDLHLCCLLGGLGIVQRLLLRQELLVLVLGRHRACSVASRAYCMNGTWRSERSCTRQPQPNPSRCRSALSDRTVCNVGVASTASAVRVRALHPTRR